MYDLVKINCVWITTTMHGLDLPWPLFAHEISLFSITLSPPMFATVYLLSVQLTVNINFLLNSLYTSYISRTHIWSHIFHFVIGFIFRVWSLLTEYIAGIMTLRYSATIILKLLYRTIFLLIRVEQFIVYGYYRSVENLRLCKYL